MALDRAAHKRKGLPAQRDEEQRGKEEAGGREIRGAQFYLKSGAA